jgi:tetratricopeptide (TPR) repeat protein
LAHERLNEFADARLAFERAAAGAFAGRSQLYASIGRLAANALDFPGAVDAFTRSVGGSPNDTTMHRLLAGALQQVDRTDEAVVELVAAVLIDPEDADAHARIGQMHLDAGRLDEAAGALRRAIELSPSHVQARYALATTLMRLGNTQEAGQELARVEEAQRQRLADRRRSMAIDVLKEEAAVRAAEARHDRAAELWQQVIEREPGRASNHLGLAVALAAGGRMDAAIAQYEQAIAIGVDPDAYRQLAALYERVGRRLDAARARTLYEKVLREGR